MLFNVLRCEEGLIMKYGHLIKFNVKELFIGKHADNKKQNLFPDSYLILVNIPEDS